MSSELPVVSVCTITYNHERYIAQCIEGVVNQKCNFKFEMLIGEDVSKDKTRAIVEEYAARHPDIIVPLYAEKNQGAKANAAKTVTLARGKYIAFLEGDDYWTDLNKLQRQFDFLEANPEYTMCFTRVDVIDETGNKATDPYPLFTREDFGIEDVVLAENSFIPTPTMFFRNILPRPLPDLYVNAMSGDIAMQLLLGDKGKFRCLPGKSAIYREHAGGITKTDELKKKSYGELFQLLVRANEYFEFRHDKVIKERLMQMSKIKLIFGSKDMKGLQKLKYVRQNIPDYLKYSGRKNIKEMIYYATVLFFPSLLKLKK